MLSLGATSRLQYRSGHFESSRTAVLEDLGAIYILPITILPDLLPGIGLDLTEQLKEVKTLYSVGGKWKQWPADPVNTTGLEDSVFQALPLLFQCIIQSCGIQSKAKLVDNPGKAPSSTRSNSSRPDGYFLRQPATFAKEKGEPSNTRKLPKSTIANVRKIIWSMHRILRNDPCRRFTYGITIENTEMRVWLCHRSATLVTASFNFITDHDKLMNLVTSLAFAGNTSLGWDPTLRRKQEGGATWYEIDVNAGPDGQIQTIISDFGAEAMQGRGTQVYRAKAMNGSPVVVKDVWREHDRDREGDILKEIQRKMREDEEIDFEQDKKLFPSYAMAMCRFVDTACGSSKGSIGPVPLVLTRIHTHMGTKRVDASQAHHRVHYRIVFAELGQSVDSIRNLPIIFQVLEEATKALMLMHKYDFVHRDVSAGNILSVNGRGILADLEYAKHVSDNSQHDVPTGTLYFMAAEVANNRYLFPGARLENLPPFKYNALHDMKSLWWIAAWSLFTNGMLFPPYTEALNRYSIMERPIVMRHMNQFLSPVFREAAKFVTVALYELLERYKLVEKGPNIDTSAILGIYDIFCGHLKRARESSPLDDVVSLENVKGDGPPAKRAHVD
ncbi:hypothetical protein K439DRAFT_1658126 [Ramaria rubella]|nr:hypothetical protein K439DRAFT_1658126 [Ramaria rubella]